jgi:ribosomal-protein-alanine N-acetyltransferase
VSVPRLRLEEGSTAIRPFARGDLDALLDLRKRNQEFMAPYEAEREESFFTRGAQAREIALDNEAWAAGAGYAFAILGRTEPDGGDRLIGRIALSNVVRGPWQNATLGYWIDEASGGRGHATRAVLLVCRFAFEHAGLHRVQPAIMPRNKRSQRVVEKVGFRREGSALRYLKIAGVWEDHHIYALTREDWGLQRQSTP